MAAIHAHCRQIQLVLDGANAGLPRLVQTSITAPLAKMVVNRVLAELLFVWLIGTQRLRSHRQLRPLTAGVQAVKNVNYLIENLEKRYPAHKTSLRCAQVRQKVALEFVLGYSDRYGAHGACPVW